MAFDNDMSTLQPQSLANRGAALAGEVILLLEDDELVRRATERMLRRYGAEVVTAAGSSEALSAVANRGLAPSCVIADYWLDGGESGLAAAAAIRQGVAGPLRGFIITGDLSRDVAEEVARAGLRLLRKPVSVDAFLDALTEAV